MGELLLTIDSSSTAISFAVSRGEKLLGEFFANAQGAHADRLLLPSLDHLLRSLGLKTSDFDAIAAVIGPGSFTGLRVGIATAKGLAMSSGIPLLGVSSLRALALQAGYASLPVWALLDARKQEVYAAPYACEGEFPEPLAGEAVIKPEALLARLDGEYLFIGSGAEIYRPLIEARLGVRARFLSWSLQTTRAGQIAALALADFRRGNTVPQEQFLPRYIRHSEAEKHHTEDMPEAAL